MHVTYNVPEDTAVWQQMVANEPLTAEETQLWIPLIWSLCCCCSRGQMAAHPSVMGEGVCLCVCVIQYFCVFVSLYLCVCVHHICLYVLC